MAVNTISVPEGDALTVYLWNKSGRRSNTKVLDADRKYVVPLIALAPGVTQPDDYVALKAAVEGITGIQEAELLVDGQCPASIPTGKRLVLVVEAHLRIEDDPEA